MGIKTVYLVGCLTMVSQLLYLIGICLPFHQVSFFSVWAVRVARMQTYPLWITFPEASNDFCWVLEKISASKKKLKWCRRLEGGGHSIQDLSQRMCAKAIRYVWPNFCVGMSSAFIAGVAIVLVVVANFALQAAAAYLLYDYGTRKPNPRYRMIALVCIFSGASMVILSLLLYYAFVIVDMDSITAGGIGGTLGSAALSANTGGIGIAPGYIICWCGLLTQLGAIGAFEFTRNYWGEEAYEERKLEEEFSAMYGNPGGYGSVPQQGYMQPVQSFGGVGHAQYADAGFGLPPAQQPVYPGATQWQAGPHHPGF